jgi:serine/threonine-protein kinase
VTEGFAHGLVGITLEGRYRLDAVLGEGGMGSVFRATHLAMDRKVAVKLLKPHLASDDDALQRFAREARATQRVESPHAVKILDFGVTPQRDYYMVLEYLDGRTVQRELEIDGAFAPARVAHIARHALAALSTAHRSGLIHRDVKPDNLLLMRSGSDPDYTKILDFGVAKLMQGAAGEPALLALTAKGMVFGTPDFMSPEQALGQALDGRSDLYSLAATMFAMLTSAAPFEGRSAIELLTHHVRTPAPRLTEIRPELAAYPELDDLLQRCLAKPREHRPDSAEDMEALIAAIEPTLSRGGSASDRTRRARASAGGSGYVEALGDTLKAPAAVVAAAAPSVPARPRRRWWIGAAAAIAVGAIVGWVLAGHRAPVRGEPAVATSGPATANAVGTPSSGAVATGGSSEPAEIPAVPSAVSPTANAVGSPSTARRIATPAAAPTTGPRAAPTAPAAAPETKTQPPTPVARNPAADDHLRGAEAALIAGNALRQLAEADLALRADPNSVRAKYLLGDALIKSGDLDRGCTYLRALRRSVTARDRARAAGCPGD